MSRAWRTRDWAGYRAYRAIREEILTANTRDNAGRCTIGLPGVCTGQAEQIHHVRGVAYGHDPRFMVPACKACNLKLGDPTRRAVAPRPTSSW